MNEPTALSTSVSRPPNSAGSSSSTISTFTESSLLDEVEPRGASPLTPVPESELSSTEADGKTEPNPPPTPRSEGLSRSIFVYVPHGDELARPLASSLPPLLSATSRPPCHPVTRNSPPSSRSKPRKGASSKKAMIAGAVTKPAATRAGRKAPAPSAHQRVASRDASPSSTPAPTQVSIDRMRGEEKKDLFSRSRYHEMKIPKKSHRQTENSGASGELVTGQHRASPMPAPAPTNRRPEAHPPYMDSAAETSQETRYSRPGLAPPVAFSPPAVPQAAQWPPHRDDSQPRSSSQPSLAQPNYTFSWHWTDEEKRAHLLRHQELSTARRTLEALEVAPVVEEVRRDHDAALPPAHEYAPAPVSVPAPQRGALLNPIRRAPPQKRARQEDNESMLPRDKSSTKRPRLSLPIMPTQWGGEHALSAASQSQVLPAADLYHPPPPDQPMLSANVSSRSEPSREPMVEHSKSPAEAKEADHTLIRWIAHPPMKHTFDARRISTTRRNASGGRWLSGFKKPGKGAESRNIAEAASRYIPSSPPAVWFKSWSDVLESPVCGQLKSGVQLGTRDIPCRFATVLVLEGQAGPDSSWDNDQLTITMKRRVRFVEDKGKGKKGRRQDGKRVKRRLPLDQAGLLNTWKLRSSLDLFVKNDFSLLPFALEQPYALLGTYKIIQVYVEASTDPASSELTLKFVFKWDDEVNEGPAWWHRPQVCDCDDLSGRNLLDSVNASVRKAHAEMDVAVVIASERDDHNAGMTSVVFGTTVCQYCGACSCRDRLGDWMCPACNLLMVPWKCSPDWCAPSRGDGITGNLKFTHDPDGKPAYTYAVTADEAAHVSHLIWTREDDESKVMGTVIEHPDRLLKKFLTSPLLMERSPVQGTRFLCQEPTTPFFFHRSTWMTDPTVSSSLNMGNGSVAAVQAKNLLNAMASSQKISRLFYSMFTVLGAPGRDCKFVVTAGDEVSLMALRMPVLVRISLKERPKKDKSPEKPRLKKVIAFVENVGLVEKQVPISPETSLLRSHGVHHSTDVRLVEDSVLAETASRVPSTSSGTIESPSNQSSTSIADAQVKPGGSRSRVIRIKNPQGIIKPDPKHARVAGEKKAKTYCGNVLSRGRGLMSKLKIVEKHSRLKVGREKGKRSSKPSAKGKMTPSSKQKQRKVIRKPGNAGSPPRQAQFPLKHGERVIIEADQDLIVWLTWQDSGIVCIGTHDEPPPDALQRTITPEPESEGSSDSDEEADGLTVARAKDRTLTPTPEPDQATRGENVGAEGPQEVDSLQLSVRDLSGIPGPAHQQGTQAEPMMVDEDLDVDDSLRKIISPESESEDPIEPYSDEDELIDNTEQLKTRPGEESMDVSAVERMLELAPASMSLASEAGVGYPSSTSNGHINSDMTPSEAHSGVESAIGPNLDATPVANNHADRQESPTGFQELTQPFSKQTSKDTPFLTHEHVDIVNICPADELESVIEDMIEDIEEDGGERCETGKPEHERSAGAKDNRIDTLMTQQFEVSLAVEQQQCFNISSDFAEHFAYDSEEDEEPHTVVHRYDNAPMGSIGGVENFDFAQDGAAAEQALSAGYAQRSPSPASTISRHVSPISQQSFGALIPLAPPQFEEGSSLLTEVPLSDISSFGEDDEYMSHDISELDSQYHITFTDATGVESLQRRRERDDPASLFATPPRLDADTGMSTWTDAPPENSIYSTLLDLLESEPSQGQVPEHSNSLGDASSHHNGPAPKEQIQEDLTSQENQEELSDADADGETDDEYDPSAPPARCQPPMYWGLRTGTPTYVPPDPSATSRADAPVSVDPNSSSPFHPPYNPLLLTPPELKKKVLEQLPPNTGTMRFPSEELLVDGSHPMPEFLPPPQGQVTGHARFWNTVMDGEEGPRPLADMMYETAYPAPIDDDIEIEM